MSDKERSSRMADVLCDCTSELMDMAQAVSNRVVRLEAGLLGTGASKEPAGDVATPEGLLPGTAERLSQSADYLRCALGILDRFEDEGFFDDVVTATLSESPVRKKAVDELKSLTPRREREEEPGEWLESGNERADEGIEATVAAREAVVDEQLQREKEACGLPQQRGGVSEEPEEQRVDLNG